MTEHTTIAADAPNRRFAWLDTARGIGIILVVYAHQMRAQATRGLVPVSWDGPFQDALIYAFHMPLFFFISGIVSVKAIRGRSFQTNLRDKLLTIAYPYFLWSIASWCLSASAGKYVNNPLGLESLISIVYQPILQFWFLYVLFFCHIVAAAFGRVFAVNVILALVMIIAPLPFDYPMIKQFAMAFPFFVVGMLASKMLLSSAGSGAVGPSRRSATLHYAGATAALIALVWLTYFPPTDFAFIIQVRAWLGIAGVVMLSRMIGSRMPWLTALGEVSMAIFVLHTIIAALLRTILARAGVEDPLILLITCVVGGLLIPVIIAKIAGRYGLEVKLGLGKTRHTTSKTGQHRASVAS
ncbi:acyltransferase [Sphingomonas aliaeris]|uniref:Acyltransferase n=1 Tax=Sphingomonas aliaeris TaxID=2759526 RepID=A0A974S5G6_9SPHN|nr:acyltransferase [Sphingomonas aliaeris]QQV78070.1 acyltransferase [Sphingomonas aliaeris]